MYYKNDILTFLKNGNVLKELFENKKYHSKDDLSQYLNIKNSKIEKCLNDYKISNSYIYKKTLKKLKSNFETKIKEKKTSIDSEVKKIEDKYKQIRDAYDFTSIGFYWFKQKIEYSLLDFLTSDIDIPQNNAITTISRMRQNDLNIVFNDNDDDKTKQQKIENRCTLIERLKEQKIWFYQASTGYAYGAFIEYLSEDYKKEGNWKDLIEPDLHNCLESIEGKIQTKIEKWKNGEKGSLIECAAFCQLLFDRKYFVKGSTNRDSVYSFALRKYGLYIENQLNSTNKTHREKHKTLLSHYFKEV